MWTTEAKPWPYGIMIENRMHQQTWKAYKKREIEQTETESLNLNLTLIFEDSNSGSENSDGHSDWQYWLFCDWAKIFTKKFRLFISGRFLCVSDCLKSFGISLTEGTK